jgi:hypothetical protein
VDAALGFSGKDSVLAPASAGRPLRALLWLIQYVLTTFFMTYAGSAFALFEWHKAVLVYKRLFYSGHAVAVLMLLLGTLLAPKAAPRAPKGTKGS